MTGRMWIAVCSLSVGGSLIASAAPRRSLPRPRSRPAQKAPLPKKPLVATKPLATISPVTRVMTPEEARMSVAMLGDAYDLLLEEIHETYHTQPSSPVAATVLRKLHARMTDLGWPQARFLAVNAILMHPDHVARDKFEADAIQALRRGSERVEETVDGQLRVATVVPLGGRCTSCHWSPGAGTSKAATTWMVPLKGGTEEN